MTLSSFPPQLIPEVDNETDEDEQTKLLKSPRRTLVKDDGDGSKTVLVKETDSAKDKRNIFQQRKSITISSDEPLLPLLTEPHKKSSFSKSSTSPSTILAKFKERIQQSLFIKSTEWPSAAAILNERRQKANEQAKASLKQKELDIESIHLTELSKKRKRYRRSDTVGHAPDDEEADNSDRFRRCRMKSDPVVYSSEKEDTPLNDTFPPELARRNSNTAKEYFRRRSISEDTYDRLPPSYLQERKQLQAIKGKDIEPDIGSTKSSVSGGIICSNEDLQEILTIYKREKSPSDPSVKNRHSYKSQISSASQKSICSSVTNDNQESICDSSSRVHSRSNSYTASVHVYPEIVLDSGQGKSTPLSLGAVGIEDKENKVNDNDDSQQPPEIIFDEYGQTWDVYGAEFDPEILGSAIQKHLEKLMNNSNSSEDVTSPQKNDSYCTQQEHESRSKAFVEWWRFLCLFGANRQRSSTLCQ
jgi:hypothetical protein